MSLAINNASSLKTLRIPNSELASVIFKNGGKEISFNGEMYDVKDKSLDGNYTIFHCLNDKKETKLIANLNDHVKNDIDTNTPNKKQNNLFKNPIKDLFFSEKKTSSPTSAEIVFPSAIFHYTSYISSPLPLPPPEVSLSST